MKRNNIFHIFLELLVILGCIIVGMSLLTYILQDVAIDKVFLGSMVIAIGLIGICDYATMKFTIRRKSLQNLLASFVLIATGILFIVLSVEISIIYTIFGAVSIVVAFTQLITSTINLSSQPLLNGARMIIKMLTMVFCIFLLAKSSPFIYTYITFLSIALLAEAVVLVVEFIIHRYQN